jgi:hypothetical protein
MAEIKCAQVLFLTLCHVSISALPFSLSAHFHHITIIFNFFSHSMDALTCTNTLLKVTISERLKKKRKTWPVGERPPHGFGLRRNSQFPDRENSRTSTPPLHSALLPWGRAGRTTWALVQMARESRRHLPSPEFDSPCEQISSWVKKNPLVCPHHLRKTD